MQPAIFSLFPPWLNREDRPAVQRYLLKIAAAQASPKGTLTELAGLMGLPVTTLSNWAAGVVEMPPLQIVALEKLIGREAAPREAFRPDLFDLPKENP